VCGLLYRCIGPELSILDDLGGLILKGETVLNLSGDGVSGFGRNCFPLLLGKSHRSSKYDEN